MTAERDFDGGSLDAKVTAGVALFWCNLGAFVASEAVARCARGSRFVRS